MTKLRQVMRPADRASWTEHFYTGTLRVRNGVAETNNQEWVKQLLSRGYKIIQEPTPPTEVVGEAEEAVAEPSPENSYDGEQPQEAEPVGATTSLEVAAEVTAEEDAPKQRKTRKKEKK